MGIIEKETVPALMELLGMCLRITKESVLKDAWCYLQSC